MRDTEGEMLGFLRQATPLGMALQDGNRLAYICSPHKGGILARTRNIIYARRLTRAAADLGLTPVTPHLYLTQVFDDRDPKGRAQGVAAGMDILKHCGTVVIGVRYGVSEGMAAEIRAAAGKNTVIIV